MSIFYAIVNVTFKFHFQMFAANIDIQPIILYRYYIYHYALSNYNVPEIILNIYENLYNSLLFKRQGN